MFGRVIDTSLEHMRSVVQRDLLKAAAFFQLWSIQCEHCLDAVKREITSASPDIAIERLELVMDALTVIAQSDMSRLVQELLLQTLRREDMLQPLRTKELQGGGWEALGEEFTIWRKEHLVPGNTTADCLTHIDLLVRVSKTMRTQWSFIFLASLPERQLVATISNGLTAYWIISS